MLLDQHFSCSQHLGGTLVCHLILLHTPQPLQTVVSSASWFSTDFRVSRALIRSSKSRLELDLGSLINAVDSGIKFDSGIN